MLAGTSVNSGGGYMIVTCVGLFSQEGIINRLITGAGAEEVRALGIHVFADLARRSLLHVGLFGN